MERRLYQVHNADKLFYYLFSENETCNLVLRLTLHCRVRREILKKALNKTLLRFPNFRRQPVLDEQGFLHMMESGREAEVYAYEPYPVCFGTEDTRGFLFRVMYEGKKIWISVFHGVCDGRGYMMFARSLLYNYFTLAGYDIRNNGSILTEEVAAVSTEMADPLEIESEAEPCPNAFKAGEDKEIYEIPDKVREIDDCRHYGIFHYTLDTDRLCDLARETGTTVDTYVHLLAARVIHDSYETGGKTIAGMGAVDLRPYYQSRYLQNMRELFWIYYPEAMFGLSDRDASHIIQKEFKEPQLTRDNFDGVIEESKRSLADLLTFPLSVEEGLRMLRNHVWNLPDLHVTYFTTNLGRLGLGPDMDQLVESADMYGPDIFHCPCIFLLTQGKETSVSLTQRSFNRYFPLKLKEAFVKRGLLIRDELGIAFENDKLRVGMLPVIRDIDR